MCVAGGALPNPHSFIGCSAGQKEAVLREKLYRKTSNWTTVSLTQQHGCISTLSEDNIDTYIFHPTGVRKGLCGLC